jgi:adenylate cyclase class 2
MSRRETEIKLAFSSAGEADRAIRALGAAETHRRTFEDNTLYDLPGGVLAGSGRLLRLRRYGDETLLTFKGPVAESSRHKVRVEEETSVADASSLERILEGLGFAPAYRYQKFRTTFRLGSLEIAIDETPIGTYVEVEGSPDEIDRAAERLGFAPDAYELATYRELHERDAASRGVPVGDLLMPDASGAP